LKFDTVLVIQDLLGRATPRTTKNDSVHPAEKKVRVALDKLPGVISLNQLVECGLLRRATNVSGEISAT